MKTLMTIVAGVFAVHLTTKLINKLAYYGPKR